MVSRICKKGYEVRVQSDGAGGYFKGAVDYRTNMPICRLTCVVSSEKLAARLPFNRQFDCKDNVDCNGGYGCFKSL